MSKPSNPKSENSVTETSPDDVAPVSAPMPNTTSADDPIKALEAKCVDLELNWKRALADYQNLSRRTKEDQLSFVKFATVGLVEKLLPTLDHLKLAAKHLNDSGLNMVIKQFNDVLTEEGFVLIKTENQVFDPTTMECIDRVDGEANLVIEQVSDGYQIGDRVIRPAKVKVGKLQA